MLIFDLETDGFLSQVSKIHCLAIHDTEKDETYVYNDEGNQEPITRGIQMLDDAPMVCGHNIIGMIFLLSQSFTLGLPAWVIAWILFSLVVSIIPT